VGEANPRRCGDLGNLTYSGDGKLCVCDLSAVFSFAKRRDIVSINPCATAAVRKTDISEERYLTR
jgi:hypothetical protein